MTSLNSNLNIQKEKHKRKKLPRTASSKGGEITSSLNESLVHFNKLFILPLYTYLFKQNQLYLKKCTLGNLKKQNQWVLSRSELYRKSTCMAFIWLSFSGLTLYSDKLDIFCRYVLQLMVAFLSFLIIFFEE